METAGKLDRLSADMLTDDQEMSDVSPGCDSNVDTARSAADPHTVITGFSEHRLEYYRGLGNWPHFGAGWTNRTNGVEQAALKMVGTVA